MGLRELLLQKLLGAAELGRENLRDPFQSGLRTALLHFHGEDGLVELRVACVIQRIFHLRILEQGCDQRVDYGVIRIQDLDADGVFLFLKESKLHEDLRRGSADLRLCGTDSLGLIRRGGRERGMHSRTGPTRRPNWGQAASLECASTREGRRPSRNLGRGNRTECWLLPDRRRPWEVPLSATG